MFAICCPRFTVASAVNSTGTKPNDPSPPPSLSSSPFFTPLSSIPCLCLCIFRVRRRSFFGCIAIGEGDEEHVAGEWNKQTNKQRGNNNNETELLHFFYCRCWLRLWLGREPIEQEEKEIGTILASFIRSFVRSSRRSITSSLEAKKRTPVHKNLKKKLR